MRKLLVFNQVSLDGYIADAHGDMSWAHKDDPEWREYVSNNASGDGELLFGRVTYQQMESFWPTPMAAQSMPVVAKRMNEATKVVFSRTLERASWQNTQLIKTDLPGAVRKLKSAAGPALVLMGSGKSMFEGVKQSFELALTNTRRFENGNVVLSHTLAR